VEYRPSTELSFDQSAITVFQHGVLAAEADGAVTAPASTADAQRKPKKIRRRTPTRLPFEPLAKRRSA